MKGADQPVYVVFAGVNGAGKTTFFRTGRWKTRDTNIHTARINPDEILLSNHGDWKSEKSQISAAKRSVKLADSYMNAHKSFNQETTLSGKTSIKRIKRAKDLGYYVIMYYIGVANADVACSRIRHRVEIGGHGIEPNVVRRRYAESIHNLSEAVRLCDQVIVMDNTVEFVEVAQWANGILAWVGKLNSNGSWLFDAIKDPDIWG